MPWLNVKPNKKEEISISKKRKQKIYQNKKWKDVIEFIKLRFPFCLLCASKYSPIMKPMEHCHHIVELKKDISKAFDYNNVMPICANCHSKLHNNKNDEDIDWAKVDILLKMIQNSDIKTTEIVRKAFGNDSKYNDF